MYLQVKCPHVPLSPVAAAAAAATATKAAVKADSGRSSTVSRRWQSAAAARVLLPLVPRPSPAVALGAGCNGEVGGAREEDGNSDGSGMVPILEIFSGT